jgi:glycosyltransferase involved in cell wall biosynthesis
LRALVTAVSFIWPSVTPAEPTHVNMKVCHVITGLSRGGAETMLEKLIGAMPSSTQHTVISLTGRGSVAEVLEARGARVIALDLPPGMRALTGLPALRREIRAANADIVQTWMYHANLLGGIAARLCGIRAVVWNIRAAELNPGSEKSSTIWVARIGARLSRALARCVIVNSHAAAAVHERIGYPRDLLNLIPNGFDLAVFKPDHATRSAVRAELGIEENVPVIGMVGRVHPAKDHPTFLEAAGQLHRERPDVVFVLSGRGATQENAVLQSLIEAAGLGSAIRLLGSRSDPARVLAAMDVCSLTSLYESFPNVLGEAMACGVLCVATDVGDSAEIIGDAGAVVPPRDPEGLRRAWAFVLDLPPAERTMRSERARDSIRRRYELSSIATMYHQLYLTVISRNGTGRR